MLAPLIEDPARAAVLFDIDGTIAPIVDKAEDALVPPATCSLLGRAGQALPARGLRLRALGGRGPAHGRGRAASSTWACTAPSGWARGPQFPSFARTWRPWRGKIREFAASNTDGFRLLGIRSEDKGPIVALHWRGAPDEAAARRRLDEVAAAAAEAGLNTHWGRKVIEIRPPVEISKRLAVLDIVRESGARAALFGGDDTTDLDAFDALDELMADGTLTTAVRVGVHSDEGPRELVERGDVVVEGVRGFKTVLEMLAG